ncbi:putative myb family transcription factor [Colletotrichum karsti]|uniref:Myb family transcription factor n=1 Tax=Colletotrichum karsti TaxID=1095194 RepID=A0A9P6HVL3_9PEZI|nr:putative myb family transcription factor [Colletotrichum karsti]KAF9869666.1 putative myb family transcription factor [Colletotrichum karsti]
MPVSLAPAANPIAMYNQRMTMPQNAYYTMPSSSAPMQHQPQPTYESYAPVAAPPVSVPPLQHRASSGAWTPQDDQQLLTARSQGLNWGQIQMAYFPNKTPNACRKRHERLMERKGADDWDNRKFERLAKEYMNVRKEIWSILAARTGEKWGVVEAKCMSNGLKNLQSASRAAARRERLESGQPLPPGYDDDSGISGLGLTDDLDASYSSPETVSSGHSGSGGSTTSAAGYVTSFNHLQPLHAGQYGYGHTGAHHGYNSSVSSNASVNGGYPGQSQSPSPYLHPHGQRLPSVDMGIDAIINRPGGGAQQPM